jgi:hypothetical protein
LTNVKPALHANLTPGSRIFEIEAGTWRLGIPAGPGGRYRLAQLDDYSRLPRAAFPWKVPFALQLKARASQAQLPGTWGFGVWNDPFSLSMGFGGGARRFPALPNAAWFFFASPPNSLSIYDDQPGCGNLAAVFRAPSLPAPLLTLGALTAPMLALPPLARGLRRLMRRVVKQEARTLDLDATTWHDYRLEWTGEGVRCAVDGHPVFSTNLSPAGPLGLVIWIDNQYAAFPADGRLRYGTLPNPQPAWIELSGLVVKAGEALTTKFTFDEL